MYYYNNGQGRPVNPKTFFKTISIIFLALFLGQVLFGIVAFFNSKNPKFSLTSGNDPLFYIVPVFIISCAVIGFLLYKKIIGNAVQKTNLAEKLGGYQAAFIVRSALTEGPSLFSIVGFMVEQNLLFLVLAGLNIVYFISFRPNRLKLEEDLNLSYEDKAEMGF